MKRYHVKSVPGVTTVMEVLSRHSEEYRVRLTRRHGDWDEVEESVMTAELFQLCLRTGYIQEIPDAAAVQVA